ncbi:PepSY-associated TM helix domain-containing protein [Flavobacterium sp. '19STA2R22 D10 B1']|uniref:PepSY-associated TM helix domain-containing protein n=1 Tax=Flavobacterium aerium TaxID=3037261 RepID=UPI00278C0432|nr:PepSY-associated TM helix domain-containing protein [Flavobacterium sp. '19STA2R22 D10 B1']
MKKKQGYTFRKFINDIHLWLGVGSSLVLFLVCLSGTIYTFRTEIEQWIEPEKFHIETISENQNSFDAIIKSTEESAQGKVTRVSFYDNPHKPYELQVSKGKEDKRGKTFYINPYNNTVLGSGDSPSKDFFMFFFKMHRWLLLDESIGRPIVGIATLIFVLLTISGLYLWLPKKIKGFKSLKPGFKIKFSANWKRINHDLHNTLGFYTFLIVLILALSGLNWSFDWYRDGLSAILGKKVFYQRNEKKLNSTIVENQEALSSTYFLKVSDSILPYQGKTTISIPKSAEDAIEVSKIDGSKFNETANDRLVFDQFSGKILKKEIFAEKAFGDKLASQMKSIHLGDIYGLTSKIIYFIACLIATSLPVTGIFIWLNKMKKSNKKKAVA